jgi:hypothetical protein
MEIEGRDCPELKRDGSSDCGTLNSINIMIRGEYDCAEIVVVPVVRIGQSFSGIQIGLSTLSLIPRVVTKQEMALMGSSL